VVKKQTEKTAKKIVAKKKEIALSPIVKPAVTPVEAKKAWKAYQELKKAVMEKNDVQIIQGQKFLKKSYWRKLATFFNLSVEVVEERKEEIGKNVVFHFVCKAIAPNGRYAIGSGSCSQWEKNYKNTIHNTRATAETRAFNRAVSNLVGGGEVSAEEIVGLEGSNISSSAKKGVLGASQQATGNSKKGSATEAQKKAIFAIAKSKGMDSEKIKEKAKDLYGLKSFNDISGQEASDLIKALQAS